MPPVEEISSSLLVPDESADDSESALLAVEEVEELSGSLLLEDPGPLNLDDPTVVLPPAAEVPAAPAPAMPPREAAPAPTTFSTLLGMPELPTTTPPPNLHGVVPVTLPSSTPTLRPPESTPHAMPSPNSTAMAAALPADGVPPPPEQMFEALHGFEAAQLQASPPMVPASPVKPAEAPPPPPPPPTTQPISGDVELTALPRGSLVLAIDGIKRTWGTLKSALADDSSQVKRQWFLPAIALAGLVVGVAVVAVVVSLARQASDASQTRVEPSAVGPTVSAPEAASVAPLPLPAPAASFAPAPVVENVASTTPCRVLGKSRVVAPSAIVSAGVEVRALGADIALGFSPNEHQATAVRIDPSSLSPSSTVDAQSSESVRRVVPLSSANRALSIATDVDRDGDSLQGRRTVSLDPPLEIGASGGKLVWGRPGAAAGGVIWPLDGEGKVEALRGATDPESTPPGSVTAIAMRFGGAVWMGAATGRDALTAQGPLSRAAGMGDAVGSPAIAINDGIVIVAWADRAASTDPWRMRWIRFKAGEPAGEAGTFVPPAGGKGEQVMSPGLAAVPGGRFLLVWTDGPTARHDVRALTLSREGLPLGKPLDISNRSDNAGQGQAAVNGARQGVVAFLESTEGGFHVAATPITCSP
jgi:hypothetical protein